MFSGATVITSVPEASVEAEASATTRISLLKRTRGRRLSWAQVQLNRRPGAAREASEALAAVMATLTSELGVSLSITGRLLESVVSPSAALSRHSVHALIELGPLHHRAVLELDLLTVGQLLSPVVGSGSRSVGPFNLTRLEESALGWLCLLAVASFRGLPLYARWGGRLLSLHTDRDEVLQRLDGRQRYLAFELELRLSERPGVARLLVPAAAVELAVALLPEEAGTELSPEVLGAKVTARVRAGSATLSAVELRTLRAGDVVVFRELSLEAGHLLGPLRLMTSTFELRGAAGASGFTLQRAMTRALSPTPEPAMHDDPSLPPLPVELEIELARVKLPISELATLKPGAVLPLRIGASDPVILRIGDRAIARAELVEIEGEVGARILGMSK